MMNLMKGPLMAAAAVVILRVVAEQAGAPDSISNVLSVVALHVLVVPVYFAARIAGSSDPGPYKKLLGCVAVYALLARFMVVPTYWLAYVYQWPAPRFSVANGGVVGPDVTPLMAWVVVPFGAVLIWVVISVVIGGGIGAAIIKLKRR